MVCELKDVPENEVAQEIESTLELVMLTDHEGKQA